MAMMRQMQGGGGGGGPMPDKPQPDTAEKIQISSLSLLKMLKHGRAGVPMEVMGLMLGQFVDDYTITCVDVFAMPQVRSLCFSPPPPSPRYFLSINSPSLASESQQAPHSSLTVLIPHQFSNFPLLTPSALCSTARG